MKSGSEQGLAILISIFLSFSFPAAALASGTNQWQSAAAYPNSSWAIGVVIPQGAGGLGGGSVHWEDVTNVTASLALPDISSPDGRVYAILSLMTSDGSVLQAAAGALPNRSGWLAFAWLVQGVSSGHPTYLWVLNASEPFMTPKANILISIFRSTGAWSLRITDLDAGLEVSTAFPAGPASTPRVGDQEVFALESYSRAQETFSDMGNLTLNSIWLNGMKVVSGCYFYSDWDMVHNPLFVVGSSGTSPPSFIYAQEGPPGSYQWSYAGVWVARGDPISGQVGALAVVALVGAAALGGLGIWLARRRPASSGSGLGPSSAS